MTSPTAIDDRLTAVEEDNRRLRRLSIALIVITAILAGLAVALMFVASRYGLPGSTAQIVAARQFVMRDADGKVRGLWGTDEKGAVHNWAMELGSPNGLARRGWTRENAAWRVVQTCSPVAGAPAISSARRSPSRSRAAIAKKGVGLRTIAIVRVPDSHTRSTDGSSSSSVA